MNNKSNNILLKIFQKLNFYIEYLFKREINEKKLYLDILKNKNLVVFDVGSNLGNYSKFISSIFYKQEINIHSFEPIKELLNSQKIKSGNLIKNNVAVSDKNGVIKFYERNISSQSSLYEYSNLENDKIIKSYDIETINLIDYMEKLNIKNIDILKLDVEGKELDIIKSLFQSSKNIYIKIIKIESAYRKHNQDSFSNLLEIYAILNSNNYEFFGNTNTKYLDNKIFFSDSYFVKKI